MPIEGYVGLPGGGKSYCATATIAHDLSRGAIVHTNIFINPAKMCEYVEKQYGVIYDQDSLTVHENGDDLWRNLPDICPMGTRELRNRIVIDEAHCWANARDWKDSLRRNIVWLTQHRKFFIDLIFITQDLDNLDAQIRRLMQTKRMFIDLQKIRMPLVGPLWPWATTQDIMLDASTDMVMARQFWLRRKDMFMVYESEQLLMDNDFKRVQKSAKVRKGSKDYFKSLRPLVYCIAAIEFFYLTIMAMLHFHHN